MGKRLGLLVVAAALLCAPIAASAAGSWSSEGTYGAQIGSKLKYGLKNTLLGWTSLFTTPRDAMQAGDNFVVGVARGVWNAVGQTVGGVVDVVTFPVPGIDIPLPEGGVSIGK